VGMSKYFNLSETDNLLQAVTILVALFCTFSNISMRSTKLYEDHTDAHIRGGSLERVRQTTVAHRVIENVDF